MERFVLNPFWNFVSKLFLSRKESIWACIKCSHIFPGRDNRDMGQRSSGPMGFVTLGIGITDAFFHSVGKVDMSIVVLMMLRSRSGRARNKSFHIRDDIMGVPLDLKSFISLILLFNS